MKTIYRKIFSGLLIASTVLLSSCNNSTKSNPEISTTNQPEVSNVKQSSTAATNSSDIKFKLESGPEAFSIKVKEDGAKLVNDRDKELARFNSDGQKLKIKDAADRTLGYVVTKNGYWKIEDATQTKELYVLRSQADGDYKLEDGANKQIYRIKARDYGFEIESPAKESLYKIKLKNGKLSLRNAADRTVVFTKSQFLPVAIACFGFDVLSQEQKAALAYAVNRSGGK